MEDKNVLDISWGAILKVLLAVVVVYLLYQVADILVWSVFALIISILFNPVIEFLRKVGIPRVVGVISVYLIFFGTLSALIYFGTPSIYEELKRFSLLLPEYIRTISPVLEYVGIEFFATIEEFIEFLKESSEEVAASMFNALAAIFGGISTTVFIVTMAIFLSLEGNSIEKGIKLLAPSNQRNYVLFVWKKCRTQVSMWFLTRVLAGLFVGTFSYIVFSLFGVNYAVLFSVIAGMFNFVPFVGPALASVIFFVVIALESTTTAFFVVLAFAIIQIMEGSIITPLLSKRLMGVSPALVLIAIVVGGYLWGVLGAFLAIPLLGIIFEFFKVYMEKKKEREGVLIE